MKTVKHIKNGGIEQALLEAVKETQGLSDSDEQRLQELQSMPQNRTEVVSEYLTKLPQP